MADEMAGAFVKHYYETFSANRESVLNLYHESAIMTFEGARCCDKAEISQKIMSLPFKTIAYVPSTVDIQPVKNHFVTIAVMGQLKTDEDNPLSFSQVFILENIDSNWVIINDIFRMILHNQ